MTRGFIGRALTAATFACCVLAGTAGAREKPEEILQELLQMLPGHYDNTAQVQSELAQRAQTPHEAVVLDIVPIEAIMIGDNVFYVQESIAGDPNRVLGQKLVSLGVVKKDIVETDYVLSEPLRWRNGHANPDIFKGLMIQDVRVTKGCSLLWKREGDKLVGANNPKTCHARAGGAGGIAAIQVRAELGPTEYATAEQVYDKSGKLTQGRQDEPFYRFRKVAQQSE